MFDSAMLAQATNEAEAEAETEVYATALAQEEKKKFELGVPFATLGANALGTMVGWAFTQMNLRRLNRK